MQIPRYAEVSPYDNRTLRGSGTFTELFADYYYFSITESTKRVENDLEGTVIDMKKIHSIEAGMACLRALYNHLHLRHSMHENQSYCRRFLMLQKGDNLAFYRSP